MKDSAERDSGTGKTDFRGGREGVDRMTVWCHAERLFWDT